MGDDTILRGLEDIPSNRIKRCARCGIPITPDNDSGWEVFVDGGKFTQPVCGWCNIEMFQEIRKEDDDGRSDLQ